MADGIYNTRLRITTIACSVLFILLWLRLFQLQIIQGREYQEESEANSIRVVEELPGRAIICDRRARIIAENRPSYSLSVIPFEAKRNPNTFAELAPIVSKTEYELKKLTTQNGQQSYQPIKLARDVNFKTLAAIKARTLDLAGVSYQFEPKRFYPYPIAPHTLGYIAEISEAEKKRFPTKKAGDIVGKSGIERKYEEQLAGQKGHHYLIVNALGQVTGELTDKYIPPQSGGTMYLTLDLDLQLLAEESLEGQRGAIVALDPNNGEILALASAPKYDPEVFTGVLRNSDWQMLQNDPDVPLLHRATQSGYPPGSTFKMVTLAAAIEEGLVGPNYRYHCSGSYTLGRVYHCFKKEGHGSLTPTEAIEQSCDAFFYRLGHRLGVSKLSYYMKQFGFGSPAGIDVENEIAGIAPDLEYLDRRYGKGKWSEGLAINIAIGQGEVLATPLQLAQYCGIIATKGVRAKPHVFQEMVRRDGGVISYEIQRTNVNLDPETFDVLREGMRLVVEGQRGTARWLKSDRWHMAGKTGTAQNPHGKDHALFIGFAPYEKPIIAVAVVVENVGFGATYAAPIAAKLMNRYLEINRIPEISSSAATALNQKEADVALR